MLSAPPIAPDAVLAELNRARTAPLEVALLLEQDLPHFRGTLFDRNDEPSLLTNEGAEAVQEAIAFLRTATTCDRLAWDRSLAQAAEMLRREQSTDGSVGHQAADGSSVADRVSRFAVWDGQVGENIAYGSETPLRVALDTIVDDGVPGRGHRNTLFDCAYKLAGVACGPHPRYRTVCVVVFASRVQPRGIEVVPKN